MADIFNQATEYDSNSMEQRLDGFNLMNLLHLKSGFKVLDLGCGTGYLTKELARRVGPSGKVLGIDPDAERIKLAVEKYSFPNVEFQEGTAENIPGDGYDVVFSNHVMHWCPDKDKVFQQVSRCLKEGGRFGFNVASDWSPAEVLCTPADMQSSECRQHIINKMLVPSTEELRRLISENGFRMNYTQEHTRTCEFSDASERVKFFMTHFSELGREHYNLEAMKRHIRRPGGDIAITMPYTCAVLVK